MPEKKKPAPKGAEEKAEQAKRTQQIDLEQRLAYKEVQTEEKMSVAEIFRANHFFMRISANRLNSIQDMEDPLKRRKVLAGKIKARPEAEDIPKGTKKEETEQIIAAALATNLRGKTSD
jgi:hypothetical protein